MVQQSLCKIISYIWRDSWDSNKIRFDDDVDYESVESFYLNIDSQADTPLECPWSNFNPIKPWKNDDNSYGHHQIPFNGNWSNTEKELKCYYHRAGVFLFVVYLMVSIIY